LEQLDARQVRRVVTMQLITTLIVAAGAAPFGASVALSALIGGGVCLAANAFVAFWVFRRYRAQEPGLLVMRFYGAEVAKIALILGLFTVAFVTIESLNLPALLSAYVAVQVLPAFFASVGDARSDRKR
jgi:ATP synthase protein I